MQTEFARALLREYDVPVPAEEHTCGDQLYEDAFRHPSAAARNFGGRHAAKDDSYQRLEFLGDAVVGLVVATYLYDRYPGCNEGFLTNMRSMLVNGSMLSFLSVRLGMAAQLSLSDAAEAAGVRDSAKVQEDVFEAFIGAVYLAFDGEGASLDVRGRGFQAAYRFLVNVYERHVDFAELVCKHDPTERFMQWARMVGEEPVLRTVAIDPTPGEAAAAAPRQYLTHAILSAGRIVATGRGTTRREAEMKAATAAMAAG